MAHYSKATTASQLPYYQPDRVYKNFSRPKGLALIINNVHFARSSHREGSHVDKARFRQTMVNLEYDVLEAAENLPAQAMLDVARRFATDARHSSCHNCVVAVMTHGDYDKLYGSDDATIDVHEFVECFNARVAPGLAGKPKLFFIQACRGEKQDTGVQREASEDEADVRLRNIGSGRTGFGGTAAHPPLFGWMGTTQPSSVQVLGERRYGAPQTLNTGGSLFGASARVFGGTGTSLFGGTSGSAHIFATTFTTSAFSSAFGTQPTAGPYGAIRGRRNVHSGNISS